ncbi:MAG: shikimate dehydrogenase [Nitrospinae bacterium RIFCSPLOWO2_02_39_17]|nr:MAG: shikimate dehydrogenase [Nitrospinae bacterium RIFCSPLOWO2_02_39_17]OGW10715.1 MAG: shikimate dehydrogenase [Nitrospinae bacterium RIFCSPLOWO2_12_39_15]
MNILGIIGYPIGHTLSPLMHNTAIKQLGIDYIYFPFEVKKGNIRIAIGGLKGLGIKGINVTIPHKESVIPYLDSLDEDARLIGAVNTIKLDGDKLNGYNTDGRGFSESLKRDAHEEVKGRSVVILGAGGAARAIAIQIALEGAERIVIANRTIERGEKLAGYINAKCKMQSAKCKVKTVSLKDNSLVEYFREADIIINTTPVGMKGYNQLLFAYDYISNRHLVCDIVYRPLETKLLKEADKKGARTLNGLGMLVYQGSLSFKIWTGYEMPVEVVKKTLMEELSKEKFRKRRTNT